MTILALDCGSSSVKAAVLKNGRPAGAIVHGFYRTRFDGIRAEVDPAAVLKAIRTAVEQLGKSAKAVDHVAIDVMAPSWVAMDSAGRAITPIVTHQDRRSVEIAHEIEQRVGRARHLKISGNRPIPGGISSTTWAWFTRHEPGLMRKADLVGHLSTLLVRTLTGARVTDPSNASFMGVYSTTTMGGWNDELCEAAGVNPKLLPDIHDGNVIAGKLTASASRRFGITAGTPVLTGVMDTSAAVMLRGARPGQLLNVCGSTDVLAVCTDRPEPSEKLLTRAVGVGRAWMHVSTIAAAGSSLVWVRRELFPDLKEPAFFALVRKLGRAGNPTGVRFDPYLAGDRTSMDPKTAGFSGLSLATTRDDLLAAVVDSMATASAARLPLLRATGTRLRHDVVVSGGLTRDLSPVLHRDWGAGWSFHPVHEATLKGLAMLEPVSA
jgi:xylulokinase